MKNKICKRIKNLFGLVYDSDNDIDWGFLIVNETLSESFIEEFIEYLKNDNRLDVLCRYQTLSEDFIERHKDIIEWCEVSRRQILSPEFMKKFEDYIYWGEASLFQPFIDVTHDYVIDSYLSSNYLNKLYQQTKERGWFIGYIDKSLDKYFILEKDLEIEEINSLKKVKIYWKDLILVDKVSKYEVIREVKCIKK